ncbi:hypothetical protein EVC45_38430 [Paraburkholderia sp. UYCP14C]|uniref:phosphotransferase enzyme family protein n=1 Tax=Paraburkholderia sp. UYCP14C TaxID=2511130 RepID=UPI0010228F91|nr:phosphotransferase [Paraburkholderia sp. UYCP14C]RZF24491.1 hypothetical protein EVC45_38430 [Paraburkholderia sp. UYCP14C]
MPVTQDEKEWRARVEASISACLRDRYRIRGAVSTVVKGANWTFAVDDGNRCVAFVRLYRTSGRSSVEVASELELLCAVRATPALEVARPRPDRFGEVSSEIELPDGTRRLIAIFAPAEGRELAPTIEDYRRAGAALADLHTQKALTNLAPDRDILFGERRNAETIAMIADRSPPAAHAVKDAFDEFRRLGANVPIGPDGFCHGDVRPANMRIEGERVTFIDFDDCGRGPQLLDVAAMALWLEVGTYENAAALWRAFLAGYGMCKSVPSYLSVRFFVVEHQVRIIRFLFDYCELDDGLWDQTLNMTRAIVHKAVRGELRTLREAAPA